MKKNRIKLEEYEQKTLELIAKGYTNYQIALDQGITIKGVKYRTLTIGKKIGSSRRSALLLYYYKNTIEQKDRMIATLLQELQLLKNHHSLNLPKGSKVIENYSE